MERLENIKLGAPGTLRLEDFARTHRLLAICLVCSHRDTIDPETLRRGFPDNMLIDRIKPQLRCRECGNRGKSMSLEYGRVTLPDNGRRWFTASQPAEKL